MHELLFEIHRFRNWAETADKSFGEWETAYLHWNKIYHLVNQSLETTPFNKWSAEFLAEFLYILARDNEDEIIIEVLIDYPTQLVSVAKPAVSFPDHEARWQIAYGLGEVDGHYEEIQALLTQYLLDEDEYVRRRATFANAQKGFN